MNKNLFLSDVRLLNHGISSHPENSGRLEAILDIFKGNPLENLLNLDINRLATVEELSLVHDVSYINSVLALAGKDAYLDNETILTSGSVQAALLAAGLGLELVEQIHDGKIENGFALVRPPGHHARIASGMGFCIFNNIAIAAKMALSKGVNRILILDWDVHHGNGTQEMFYDDDRVLFIDLHQENLFPKDSGLINDIGKDKGRGYTVNVPLPAGSTDADYLYVFDELVKPLALKYLPELILVSAGYDAHESDPLGFMNLTTQGYGHLTAKVKSLAKEVCQSRLGFFLEGGYDPYFLAKNVMECVTGLVNQAIPLDERDDNIQPSNHIKHLIREIYEARK